MSKINDGGRVSPDMVSHRPQPDGTVIEDRISMIGGLSLRDYFAAAALPSIYTAGVGDLSEHEIAADCYSMADAMLAARKEEP